MDLGSFGSSGFFLQYPENFFPFSGDIPLLPLEMGKKFSYNIGVYALAVSAHGTTKRTMRGIDYMSASSKKKLRKEQAAVQMTEKQLAEQKEAKKLKLYTISFVALIAVVLCIAIVAMVSQGISNSGIIERSTTAVEIGEHKLNTADLSYYYVDSINSKYEEWYSYYGEMTGMYVSLMTGLDMTKPLNTQNYDEDGKITWAEYFANVAVDNAKANYALYDLAKAAGHELTEEEQENLEYNIYMTELQAMISYQYTDLESFLKAFYSRGATEESFTEYMTVAALAASYYNAHSDSLEYTPAQITAYDAEHTAEFNSYSYSSFLLRYTDFRSGGTKGEDGTTTYTDAENDAALKAAEAAAKQIAAGTYASADEMEAAIKALDAYKDNSSTAVTDQEDVAYGNVITEIREWITDKSRKDGEVGMIPYTTTSTDAEGNKSTTTHGYYVVYFAGMNDNTFALKNVRHILKQFEGGTENSSGVLEYTEAEKLAARKEAEDVLKKWQEGAATEESFAALVADNSDDGGSTATGGLYEDIYPGQMVTAFEDWCYDESRKVGDTGIVETEYGYHVMYFVGDSETSFREYQIESTLHNQDMQEWYDGIVEKVKAENINISKLPLNLVMQSSN